MQRGCREAQQGSGNAGRQFLEAAEMQRGAVQAQQDTVAHSRSSLAPAGAAGRKGMLREKEWDPAGMQ